MNLSFLQFYKCEHLNVWVLYDYQEEEEGKIDQTEKDDLFDFVRKKDGPITMA